MPKHEENVICFSFQISYIIVTTFYDVKSEIQNSLSDFKYFSESECHNSGELFHKYVLQWINSLMNQQFHP